MIYHVVIRIIVHLIDLLCNYLIYYAIKMIYYVFKWFFRQLVDKYIIYVAINRKLLWYRLVVSTGTKGFFVKKKVLWAGVEPGPLRLENLGLPLCYTVLLVSLAAKA